MTILTSSISGAGVTVQGWGGEDGDYGEEPEQLTEIDVTVRALAECNHKYRGLDTARVSYYFPQLLTEEMFCADHNVNKDIGTRAVNEMLNICSKIL